MVTYSPEFFRTFAEHVGRDAGALAHLGATAEQTQHYIAFQARDIPVEKMAAFHLHVEIASRDYMRLFNDPDEAEHVNNLSLMLVQGWDCVTPVS